MPAERHFKNAQTWRQVSTNVPPAMYKALRGHVTKDLTMSQLLRELIAESEVMRDGLPKPAWAVELARDFAALRNEIAELRKDMISMAQTTTAEKHQEQDCVEEASILPYFEPFEECESPISELQKGKAPMWLNRLTEIFGVARKTA